MYTQWPAQGYVQRFVDQRTSLFVARLFLSDVRSQLVKRALRALQSPAYQKASSKSSSLLPPVTSPSSAAETFKLLPLSLLALRVTKIDPHEGHGHAKPKKRVKGLWTVRIEQQQEIREDLHYVWLYDGPQWKQKVYAGGALAAIMAVVMFPLWPVKLRLGVWYLSMGMLGLIGLFFAMAIFRLILFCITVFAVPPGLWLYPNLFEDVGFFDSFRPVWGWQEVRISVSGAQSGTDHGSHRRRRKRKTRSRPSKAAAKKLRTERPNHHPATVTQVPSHQPLPQPGHPQRKRQRQRLLAPAPAPRGGEISPLELKRLRRTERLINQVFDAKEFTMFLPLSHPCSCRFGGSRYLNHDQNFPVVHEPSRDLQ